MYRPFFATGGATYPSLKVGGTLTFVAGFNQFATAADVKPVASGVSTPLTWTIYDDVQSMLVAGASLVFATLLY